MNNDLLKKYAKLAVKTGVNIQKDDVLVINSPIETANFARLITEEAYNLGAKDVVVHYGDQKLTKIKLDNSSIETISEQPEWFGESYNYYARTGACFISIAANDPDGLKGVSVDKIGAYQKSRSLSLKEYYENSMSNKCRWCVIAYPTLPWAKKVFPNLSDDEAFEKLYYAILDASRVTTEDPIKAWDEHNLNLQKSLDFLNNKNIKTLHYTSSNGTDLTIELPYNHNWAGGLEESTSGIGFNANIPTEEVFTLPKKTGVNGIVYSSKPLSYGGNLIDNFSLTFKDGKVVNFTAKEGYDVLKQMLDSDEGAKYLGEVALVPYDSPISNSNLIFFNTLFDENAACHLALGRAYPCYKDVENLSKEELEERGTNDSNIHVDFMIGTKDLSITAVTNTGEIVQIFKNGNWAF